ncbi:MAG: hydantoinase/oxoprolinase family protein [Solirubrobacteraceae bacterium]
MLLGVDVGGTFTDAVLAFDGRLVTAKAPTTPRDQSQGVIAAIEAVLRRAGRAPEEVTAFAHGMTVATNALLEGHGARTALVATEGFADIVALGRQNRADLYRLCKAQPAPLVGPELRFEAPERMTPEGPLVPLSADRARELAQRIAGSGVESVAVALLHSYRHPEHERMLGAALTQVAPEAHVSLSHEVVGTFREFERTSTTEVDAALSPLLGHYLRALVGCAHAARIPQPTIMQSNGGLIDAAAAAEHAAWTVLSGPAAGAAGAAFVARASGAPDALCLDMGGTSCDVCVVDGGVVQEHGAGTVAGRPLALPMVAVHTVGAGGGSVAWRDPGGALRVGPRSAGADPGPACYGRGGEEPTVTDAHLVLGHLAADAPLAGGVTLALGAAQDAIARLASELGLQAAECAAGIIRVADAEMVRALRVVTVERGIDPRRYALLAFGGAGPLHAAKIAQELGIERIVCPRAGGVLAALGLVVSPRRRDAQRSVFMRGGALTASAIAQAVSRLADQARQALGASQAQLQLAATYELRYRGQAFELAIAAGTAPDPRELRDAFEAEHEERYGYRDAEQELELVTIRVSATLPGAQVELGEGGREAAGDAGDGDAQRGAGPDGNAVDAAPFPARRTLTLDGAEVEVDVLRGAPPAGTPIRGPIVVELPESTLLVGGDWCGAVDATGTICLEHLG